MKKRILGKNAHGDSLEVCAIGLGCMGLSQEQRGHNKVLGRWP